MNPKLVQNIQHVEKMHVTNVAAPVKQPGVPVCPTPNAATLYGRGAIIDQLVARLTGGAGAVGVSAVRGLPGVGKSDLLRAIGCDERVVRHFGGGVLYAELGPDAEPLTLLTRWLYELDREVPQSDDPRTLAAVVRGALADRPALVILDDVWQSSMAAAQLLRECATGACRILLSSRSPELAETLAGGPEHAVKLDVLEADPALALLNAQAPQAVAKDAGCAKDLCAALGQLPLALKLAAGLLRNDRRSAAPCRTLLETWHRRLDELRGYERREGSAAEQLSLDAIIGMSYAALPDDATREAAAALAVFGATPLSWDWDVMQAVWDADEAQAGAWERALIESGLLEYDAASGRYNLHQTVHAFLQQHNGDDAAALRHAQYYAALMERRATEIGYESTIDVALATLDAEIAQMERGHEYVKNAPQNEEFDWVLLSYAFSSGVYFDLRGRYDQSIAWLRLGAVASTRLDRPNNTASLLSNLGIVCRALGRYNEAINYFEQCLQIRERINDTTTAASVLSNLGNVYTSQGLLDEAIDHYQRSINISQSAGDSRAIAMTLGNLGNALQEQGRFSEAINHYEQSLSITRAIGDIAGTARALGNLGNVYQLLHRFEDAKEYLQESLVITRRIGDIAGIARQLGNLAGVLQSQGNYIEASDLYQQSLTISSQIGNIEMTTNNTWNFGTLLVEQAKLHEALSYLEQALDFWQRIKHPNALAFEGYVKALRARIAAGTGAAEPPAE